MGSGQWREGRRAALFFSDRCVLSFLPTAHSLPPTASSATERPTVQRITREQARKYAFDFRDEPLLRVKPGESFEIETYDASTG